MDRVAFVSQQRNFFIRGYRDAISGAATFVAPYGAYSHGHALGAMHLAQAERLAADYAEHVVSDAEWLLERSPGGRDGIAALMVAQKKLRRRKR